MLEPKAPSARNGPNTGRVNLKKKVLSSVFNNGGETVEIVNGISSLMFGITKKPKSLVTLA